MSMTLTLLQQYVRRRIGNPSATDVTDATLAGHVNDAYEEIRDKYKHTRGRARATFSTVLGTDKYRITDVTEVLYKAWDRTNDQELEVVGINYLVENDFIDSVQGKPVKVGRFEDYIQLLPVPNGVYQIELYYKEKFTALVNSSDIPDLPDAWHRGIGILASFNYYDVDGRDAAKATYQMQVYKNWLTDKPVESHEETEAIDSGVEMPSLARQTDKRLDFDHSS